MKRVRVRQPDVLNRHAHQPPRQKQGILARRQHARQIIQRRVGIRAAHRLVQGGNQVVMAVRRLVIKRHALLHALGKCFGVERQRPFRNTGENFFNQIENVAPVPISHGNQRRQGLRINRQRPLLEHFSPGHQRRHRIRIKPVQHQNLRPRKQRAIQFK